MNIEQELFSKYETDEKALSEYGFVIENGRAVYRKKLPDDNFEVVIEYDGRFRGRIEDLDMGGEYTNFRLEGSTGYSAEIRQKFTDILLGIRGQCCKNRYFVYSQTRRINEYICSCFGVNPEFLWESTPSFAVYRRKDSQKWFALIGNLKRSKLEPDSKSKEEMEFMNIKIAVNDVANALKNKGFYPAYHMNKKTWITVVLDGTVSDKTIQKMIGDSYNYVQK
ncbi:MAG: MmcQ/YjbR family DNA-binding protein [Clostridiales bacterium]|nr:MmcQ/YjbR family DNA-binding protein [Clostridiales bacterium]